MKPVCIPCQRFFRMKKSGVLFVEGMPAAGTSRPKSGTTEPEKWQPYKLWSGDRWECEGCGATIMSGFGLHPVAERHHEDFPDQLARVKLHQGSMLQVNDC